MLVEWPEMKAKPLHPWQVTPEEAIAIQQQLRVRIVRRNQLPPAIGRVAGIDVGFEERGAITRAAVVVLDFSSLMVEETKITHLETRFPYIPGLLSFREAPAILNALADLKIKPDLLMVDGQGLAHPRRFGIACHLGLLCELPAIGVAKSILVGAHSPLGESRGAWQPLLEKGEVIGAVLRTRTGMKPIYISIGHRIDLETARKLVLDCSRGFRLPEPIRLAHKLASERCNL